MPGINPKNKVYIDEELFLRIQNGDKDAFRELYEASYRPLYAFLLSFTRNSEDAKDLLQDTYLRIYQKSYMYQKEGNPMAWMMKIGRNLFLMKCRKNKEKVNVDSEELENMPDLSQIENAENRLLLEMMFMELSDREREIIILHDVAGMKFREIAQIVDKPVGTVLARYNRCIHRLQKKYAEEVRL